MSSSLQGKADAERRLVSDEDAVAYEDDARPTDESPTVISKTPPIVEPTPSSLNQKVVDLNQQGASPESMVAGLRGRRLAHYELIEPIGVGGMAAVIRARDTQLDRFVALKILPPEMAKERDNIERFHQEAKAAAKLDHENIARVFYCGEDQGLFFIAFEFVQGINLRTLMEQRGRMPVAEAVLYILQIATGLEHAATRGVVHRDVKPSNIIITPTGRAKLVDMGLARNLERHGQRDLTQSGVTLGTFDYISPEQALEPRDADSRSDIYSLGCTFYHMLTGMPPVPEGTPAKKLQHHQHHMPTDPRLIDPNIPDEIVMILGKMMAKDPKARYQRPIHLVHHLTQVAQKVGVTAELPEGGLFVDAPLPGELRTRPMLIIGMALAALAALTLFLSLAPDPQGNKGTTAPLVKGQDDKGPPVNPDFLKSKGPVAVGRPEVIKNREDLQKVLDDRTTNYINVGLELKKAIQVNELRWPGNADQHLEFVSNNVDDSVIRFRSDASEAGEAGLIIESGEEIIFRKVKFCIDAVYSNDQRAATVVIRGGKKVIFDQCVFPQYVPLLTQASSTTGKRVPLASILIDTPIDGDAKPVIVEINRCYFEAGAPNWGQVAIAINGPATVNVTDTAFKPHAALFSFREKCSREKTLVNVQHCAGFVVRGPAFRFSADASAQIRAYHNAFLRPVQEAGVAAPPGLIFLTNDKSVPFYEGRQNLYHALSSLIEKKTDGNAKLFIDKLPDLDEFLAKNGGSDRLSINIPLVDPINPLQESNSLTSSDDLGDLAFQLKAEYHGKFGLQKSWQHKEMPPPLGVDVVKVQPMPMKKIVDPDDTTFAPGVSKNLLQAISGADDGDIIYIKAGDDRYVVVPPVPLKPGITVTLKPYGDSKPILVLDKKFKDKDVALFKVQAGKLQIEQMEILLDPGAGYDAQAVVHLGDEGHCVFKNCVFSLKATTKAALSVVGFVDPGRMMKSDVPSLVSPRVEFHECFVRGKGDLVALNGCRLVQVELKNSLVALDGSLLDVQALSKELALGGQGPRLKIDKSSVFTTESIFALRCENGQVLSKTFADASGCLFASLVPDQPVVLLKLDKNAELDDYLEWNDKKPNYYANFSSFSNFREQFPDVKMGQGKLTFPELAGERMQILWEAEPSWFKPSDAGELKSIREFGLPLDSEKRLMDPAQDADPS